MKLYLVLFSVFSVSGLFAEEGLLSRDHFSGRVQSLSMTRDYEGVGTGANSTLGVLVGYDSPVWEGFQLGAAYNYAWELWENHQSAILANDEIHVLNEAWVRYGTESTGEITVGRKIYQGQVFRKDDYRQKARSIEAVQIGYQGITAGHALRMSNWIQAGDRWEFNSFDEVFGVAQDSEGVTWIEGGYRVNPELNVTIFDAYAWDICNLMGTRIDWDLAPDNRLIFFARMEEGNGGSGDRNSIAYGISYVKQLGKFSLEPGFFSVHGDTLFFQEATTGIDHALGAAMMICACPFNGGADSGYVKGSYSVGKTKFYGLYMYSHQGDLDFDGQELNLVVSQGLTHALSVCVKAGLGYRDEEVKPDSTATDARLFITYGF